MSTDSQGFSAVAMAAMVIVVFLVVGAGYFFIVVQKPGATENQPSGSTSDNQPPAENQENAGSDFTPAIGAAAGQPGSYGPWNLRLRVATSPDGTNWTRTGTTITDQGDVPCLIVADGKLWLFYVIWQDADNTAVLRNTTVAACSSDLVNWTFKRLNFSGDFPSGYTNNPVDPTVVAIDGGYRMYFTLGPLNPSSEKPHTFSATSTDLINWTFEGERYEVSGEDVLDPNLLWVGDHYEFFAGGSPGGNHHASSTDGLTFTSLGSFSPQASGYIVVMSNGMKVENTYKYYGFVNAPAGSDGVDIRSFSYSSGAGTWTLDNGAGLTVDAASGEESMFVKDPAISVHPTGESSGYVMVYVTVIP
jgi:hypothetical protein